MTLSGLAGSGPESFGQYLHYLQDTFSHEGYSNSTYGHLVPRLKYLIPQPGLHGNDKTATDVEKAVRMARSTYSAMSGYSQLKCGCAGTPWNDQMASTVRGFAAVKTNFPNAADIDGDTGLPVIGKSPWLADPTAMAKKKSILGF